MRSVVEQPALTVGIVIKKEDIIEIGKFQKTHALKGELNALLDIDADFVSDGQPLIVSIDGIFVPFYAESLRSKGSESYLVKLSGVDSQEQAQQFVSKEIYGLKDSLVDYFGDPELDVADDFLGYRIVDSCLGEIGVVVDIDDSTANVLFIVESPDGKQIFVPVADEFINAVDDDNQVIETSLPDGLVNINDVGNED